MSLGLATSLFHPKQRMSELVPIKVPTPFDLCAMPGPNSSPLSRGDVGLEAPAKLSINCVWPLADLEPAAIATAGQPESLSVPEFNFFSCCGRQSWSCVGVVCFTSPSGVREARDSPASTTSSICQRTSMPAMLRACSRSRSNLCACVLERGYYAARHDGASAFLL